AYFEATLLAGFSSAAATEFFGRERGFSAERFAFAPRSVTSAQNAFLKRFSAIETSRHHVATSALG
ncbi:hydrolase, partial [Mesorhizobium sp. M2D.F.Ca.ET.145.01.1.1]